MADAHRSPTCPRWRSTSATELQTKKFVLLYAYNGTGKTRLSIAFKDLGKAKDGRRARHALFNAFTEDLFNWDNDLENDRERVLKINTDSRFFAGLSELEMDNRIRPLLEPLRRLRFRDRLRPSGK